MKLLLILAWALPLQADAGDANSKREEIKDPYLLEHMEKVSEANLDNALAQSGKDALASAHRLRGLMGYARTQIDGLLEDIRNTIGVSDNPRPGTLEEDVDSLLIAAQMLPIRAREFSKSSRLANLRLASSPPEEIAGVGRMYRSGDRKLDLRRAEKFLKQALGRLRLKEPPALNAEQQQVLACASAFYAELQNAQNRAAEVRRRLPAGSDSAGLGRKIDFRLQSLRKIDGDVSTERGILEVELRLARSDDEDF
ncbi:MAG: hypothetical protein ABIJ96_01480 [Elusimicrobiota bacterium]